MYGSNTNPPKNDPNITAGVFGVIVPTLDTVKNKLDTYFYIF